jgi:hypothetical protein
LRALGESCPHLGIRKQALGEQAVVASTSNFCWEPRNHPRLGVAFGPADAEFDRIGLSFPPVQAELHLNEVHFAIRLSLLTVRSDIL